MRVTTGNPSQLGYKLPALSVEQDHRVAAVQTQDRTMARGALGQFDLGARGKRHEDEKTRRSAGYEVFHATILNISAVFSHMVNPQWRRSSATRFPMSSMRPKTC